MIAEMKKLTAACLKSDADRLCRELVRLEAIECRELSDSGEVFEIGTLSDNFAHTEKTAADISNAIESLSPFCVKKKTGAVPKAITSEEFEKLSEKIGEAEKTASETADTELEISRIISEREKLNGAIRSLEPFLKYDEPLPICGTKFCALIKGFIPNVQKIEKVRSALDSADLSYELCVISDFGGNTYIALLAHRSDIKTLAGVLSGFGFSETAMTEFEKTAAEETAVLEEKIKKLDGEISELYAQLEILAEKLPVLKAVSDYLAWAAETERVKSFLHSTECTAVIGGFVPADRLSDIEKTLDGFGCAYTLEKPAADEKVPVKLENNRFSAPFESVLGLYSYPDYRSIDPTPVMSIFYFIIFGMIMQDVLYGLILLFGCRAIAGLMKIKPGTGMRKMLDMFSICGISTAIFGVLFGGYSGDLPSALAVKMFGAESFPDLAVLFNPTVNPMAYLVLSLAVGALHLLAGLGMKAYMLIKQGRTPDALFDVGSWILLFFGTGMLFVNPSAGKTAVILGTASLVLTQGRREKNIAMKLLKGVMSLYGVINYVSDLLSYSRIMALGLSGAIIAQVVNIIGTLGGTAVTGFIVSALALVLGHTLNLALSVLGAFVHTARLQYIEFLGKFYEDGGEPFKPAKIKTKYTDLVGEAH